MTRDDITRMAREASGGMLSYDSEGQWRLNEVEAQRFAALVAEAERKRIESRPWGAGKEWIERAIEAEREACAKVCEKQINGSHYESLANRGYWDHMAQSALNCAAAIRARGEK